MEKMSYPVEIEMEKLEGLVEKINDQQEDIKDIKSKEHTLFVMISEYLGTHKLNDNFAKYFEDNMDHFYDEDTEQIKEYVRYLEGSE